MKLGSLLTALSLGLSLPFPVLAQSPGAIDQGEALRRQRDAEQLLKDLRQEKLEEAPTISPVRDESRFPVLLDGQHVLQRVRRGANGKLDGVG